METIEAGQQRPLPAVSEAQAFWERNGLQRSSAALYLQWVRRYFADCARKGFAPLAHLTSAEVRRFAERYARRRRRNPDEPRQQARQALRAWSLALSGLGFQVPTWTESKPRPELVGPWFGEYRAFRHAHASTRDESITRDLADVAGWLRFLRRRKRPLRAVRISDVDAYVLDLRPRLAAATVARILTSLRLFCRFLHSTGRLRYDLASSLPSAPRRPRQLPRALPWSDIQKLLRAVDRRTLTGLRDYTIFLLMSLYGLGCAEIIGLSLDRIDWSKLAFEVVRPKTGVHIQLPLLPPAARALARYLREGRPPDAPTRTVFVRRQMPYLAFTASAIRHAIRQSARRAGIRAPMLGGHLFRHSHACRQIDQRTPPRILSSILGHRDLESTSIYTRVALKRLRGIALPVPR